MLRVFKSFGVLAMCAATALPAAEARQAKPDPVPVQMPQEAKPDVEKWREAYAKAGRPTVMIMCGIDGDLLARPQAGIKWNFELEGEPAQIAGVLGEILNPGANPIELVDAQAIKRMQGRFEAVLNLNGKQEDIELLRAALDAELLVTIRITGGGPLPKVNVTVSEEARGRAGFGLVFDWKGDFSALEIKKNISAVAVKFIDDFAERAGQDVLSMTLRVLGAKREWQRRVRETLESVPGVSSVKMANLAAGPADQAIEFTLRHSATTDVNDLLFDAQDALTENLDTAAHAELAQGNTAIIRLTPKPPPPPAVVHRDPTCRQMLQEDIAFPDDEKETAAKQELTAAYKAKGVPKVTVLLNRRATAKEVDAARQAAGGGREVNVENMVVVTGIGEAVGIKEGPNGQDPPAKAPAEQDNEFRVVDKYELFARHVETSMSSLFGVKGLGFEMIHSDTARKNLGDAVRKQKLVMGEAELSALLLGLNIADIYVIGHGSDPTANPKIQFSFKAVTASGSEIGYGQILVSLPVEVGPDVIKPIAADLVTEIACDMKKYWKPPSRITIKLVGATGLGDFGIMRDAIEKFGKDEGISLFGTEQFDRGHGEGIVLFRIEFDTTKIPSNRLFDKLREIKDKDKDKDKAPFESFDSESKDDTEIVIRIRPSVGQKP